MIYIPIEIQLRKIREDLELIKLRLDPSAAFPYTYDPLFGRMLNGRQAPPEFDNIIFRSEIDSSYFPCRKCTEETCMPFGFKCPYCGDESL